MRKRPALHLQAQCGVHPQQSPHPRDRSPSSGTDPLPGLGHQRPLQRGNGIQPAHGAGEGGPAVRQVSVLRSSAGQVPQRSIAPPADAAALTAFPAAALQEERVVELQRVRDAEVHGHVLDVLGPICSVGPQLLHLRESEKRLTSKLN